MKSEKGFTLIEVLASLVIITLILMVFSSIFVQNNKVSVRNSDKLVVTNLADGYLERLKVLKLSATTDADKQLKCPTNYSDSSKKIVSNNHQYTVVIEMHGITLNMCNTVVKVIGKDSKTTGVVEGYVQFK